MSRDNLSTLEKIPLLTAFCARASAAIALFLSPLAYCTTLVERRVGTIYSTYTDFFWYPTDWFLLGAVLLGGLTLILRRQRFNPGPWFLTYPLAMILALSWIGVLTGIDHELTMYHSLRLTELFTFYLFLVNLPLSPAWVGLPLAAGVLVQGAVGIGQAVQQRSLGLAAWGELVLDPQAVGTSIVRDGSLRILRAYGLTDHPNLLGGFFAFALLLILGYYFASAHSHARYLLLVPLTLGTTALTLTYSRAAIVAFLVGFVFLGICLLVRPQARRERLVPAIAAGALILASLFLPLAVNRSLVYQRAGMNESFVENSGEARSFDERNALISSALRILGARSVFGVGNGALALAMYRLDPSFDTTYYYQPAHFVLLDIAAELGILGAMVWVWIIVAPWVVLYFRRREVVRSAWLAAVAAALLALTLISFADYYPWLLQPGRIWQWTVLGLAAQLLSSRFTPAERVEAGVQALSSQKV